MTDRRVKPKIINLGYNPELFPKHKNGAIYVRQSSMAQVNNNVHSFEMQTSKFIDYFRKIGCTGDIEIITIDEGVSGKIDLHDRPGMTRVLQLIKERNIGWLGAVHVNRLTRDKWGIAPGVLMKTCYENDVWVVTPKMKYDFHEEYCREKFEKEAKEAAKQLEWIEDVVLGGKKSASEDGYYDGRNLAMGYIVDRRDPRHMKYIPYQRHAEVVSWLFQRFLELDGNFPALCREVQARGYLFPPFDESIDLLTISRVRVKKIKEGPFQGYYQMTDNGIRSLLTNPVYMGYWIPLEGELIKENHEAIVSEELFNYVYSRLARKHFLTGERMKPPRRTRNTKREALLIKVIRDEEDYPVYTQYTSNDKGNFVYKRYNHEFMRMSPGFTVSIPLVDNIFLQKMFEKIDKLAQISLDWQDTIEKKKQEKINRNSHIQDAINEAKRRMNRINITLEEEDTSEAQRRDLKQRYKDLSAKKDDLEKQLLPDPKEEDHEEVLYNIKTLVPRMKEEWENLAFETKILVVSALVRKATLIHPVSGWLKLVIEWRIPDWGVDVAHFKKPSSKSPWAQEDIELLKQVYPKGEILDVLKMFPNRNWLGIMEKANSLGVHREISHKDSMRSSREAGIPLNIALEDWEYARENGLTATVKIAQWSLQHDNAAPEN